MRVAIRADASFEIGTGHVMRCLTLARTLRRLGADVVFICREEDGHLCSVIESANFRCKRLPKSPAGWETDARLTRTAIESDGGNARLLVVDHYMLDIAWESNLRPIVDRIFVIDDLANRSHDCDLLLDQNLHDVPHARYSGLIPKRAKLFLGPRYALLRPEFDAADAVPRSKGLRRMLVFLGGVDPTNESLKLVRALRAMGTGAPDTDLVLGPANPHFESVLTATRGMDCMNVLRQTEDMARLMRDADLGLGTCGVAAWERCRVGLPSLVVVSADNQRDDARILHSLGAVRNLGDASNVDVERWVTEISALQNDPLSLTKMSIAAASVMRGRADAVTELESALVS